MKYLVRQARIPAKSGLNIEAWKYHLCDYPDKKLSQYLHYGFPLSLRCPHSLSNQIAKNHCQAVQHPLAVENYSAKENQRVLSCGPLLT